MAEDAVQRMTRPLVIGLLVVHPGVHAGSSLLCLSEQENSSKN